MSNFKTLWERIMNNQNNPNDKENENTVTQGSQEDVEADFTLDNEEEQNNMTDKSEKE